MLASFLKMVDVQTRRNVGILWAKVANKNPDDDYIALDTSPVLREYTWAKVLQQAYLSAVSKAYDNARNTLSQLERSYGKREYLRTVTTPLNLSELGGMLSNVRESISGIVQTVRGIQLRDRMLEAFQPLKTYIRREVERLYHEGYDSTIDRLNNGHMGDTAVNFQTIVTHGGPGSGNFGHAGRPGKVGGSSSSSSTAKAGKPKEGDTKRYEDFIRGIDERVTPHRMNRALPGGEILVDVRGDEKNIRANYSHEVAHNVHDYLMTQEQRNEWAKIAKEEHAKGLIGKKYSSRGVSGDPLEDFPEVFSAWTSGDNWEYDRLRDIYKDFMRRHFGEPKELEIPRVLQGKPTPDESIERDATGRRKVALNAKETTANVYCPTGEGGGIDPTCKAGEAGNVDVYDPKTGEVFWTGPKTEAEQMLKEQSEIEPGHGLQIREENREENEARARESEKRKRKHDEEVQETHRRESLTTPSGHLPGHPKWVDPPERLYHATFAGEEIMKEGLKTSDELGKRVLGGTHGHLVSMTTKENAELYRDGLNIARRAARGELNDEDLLKIGVDFGVKESDMRDILHRVPSDASRSFNVLQAVSYTGKKFPFFMGAEWPKHLKTVSPATTVSVRSSDVREMYYNPDETEWRIGKTKGLAVNYDPNQPRNDQGEWTDAGKGTATLDKPKGGKVQRTNTLDQVSQLVFGKGLEGRSHHSSARQLTDDDIRAIGFSPEGTTVVAHGARGGEIHINTESDEKDERGSPQLMASRTIRKPWFGPLTCYNGTVKVWGSFKGKGLELFDKQVKTLQGLGVKRILASASGDAETARTDPKNGLGYYVWPRMGYSGIMKSSQIAKLPDEIRKALKGKRDIRDLFDLPGGAEAWKEHGSTIKVHFDLSPNSRNMRALEAYKEERTKRLVVHGGEGSGNFGHAGRPGKRGGSAPRESAKSTVKEATLPKVGDRVKVGSTNYVVEHFDNDDTFPPAIASYEIKDGVIFYTGRNGSEGVVSGSKEESEKWMKEVREWVQRDPPDDYKARPWTPEDGGKENVEKAKDMVKQVTDTFGISPLEVKVEVAKKSLEGGDFTRESVRLVNPHRSTPSTGLNIKTGVSNEIHIAAHEAMHSVFARNPTLGHSLVKELRESKEAISMYHTFAGPFEGLMDLGAAYVHSPKELKEYSPRLYEIADRWKQEFKPGG